jgi:hypothetical protein
MHASIRRLTALAALAPVFALAPTSGAAASSGLKCHQSSQYGTTCIALNGSGLYLQDVLGYFAPPNRDYLSGRRWALQLTQYPCNPIHRTTRQCSATHRWRTRTRRGNPPQQGSRCVIFTPNGIGFQQCENYGLASADANFRDWRRFFRMPHQYRRSVWLCNELVVRVGRHWRRNGAAGSVGQRGCAQVHD